jgi:LPXTG-motif cell wall-anchored protein
MFETLVMADRISNFATAAGFIVGLGVLLFVVRSRRKKEARKVKYGSNGKPISG